MTEDTQSVKRGSNEETTQEGEEEKVSSVKFNLTTDKRVDLALSVAVALIGLIILFETRDIREGMISDPISARGMPRITGVTMFIVGIALAVLRLRIWSALPGHLVLSEGKDDDEGYPASWIRAFSIIFVSMLWAVLLKPLGYLIATPLYLAAVVLLLGMRSTIGIIAYSTITTLITWYVFSQPLHIILPLGPLAPLFRKLGLTA